MKKNTALEFLDDHPEALPYHKRLLQVIREEKVPLHGNSYEVMKRAFDFERRGFEHSIESFFDAEDKLAAAKFEKESKRNAKKS